jgi:hypothetical protein
VWWKTVIGRRAKMKRLLAIVMTLTLVFGLSVPVYAFINEVRLGVWTNGDDESIAFWVEVTDTVVSPPAAVTSIMVTCPDGTTFNLMDNFWWNVQDPGFYSGRKYADEFNGGVIPSGTYTVQVQDRWGITLTATDQVTVNFLDVPVITSPTNGSTLPNLTPLITWTPVAGAETYRMIWWYREKKLYCNKNYFWIPPGVLWSGMSYRLYIQARDRRTELDNRANSIKIIFNTP